MVVLEIHEEKRCDESPLSGSDACGQTYRSILNLSYESITASHLTNILKANTTLTELRLSGSSLHFDAAVTIADALKGNSCIQSLFLHRNKLGSAGAKVIGEALKYGNSPNLTLLDMSDNAISSEGFHVIGDALKTNKKLGILRIGMNSMGCSGAQSLFLGLEKNKTLTELSLAYDRTVGVNEVRMLSNALRSNKSLKNLSLRSCLVNAEGIKAIASVLKEHPSLTSLDLGENISGSWGTIALSRSLECNTVLKELNLEANFVGETGIEALAQMLKKNSSLECLCLERNTLVSVYSSLLRDAMLDNVSLREMNVSSDPLLALYTNENKWVSNELIRVTDSTEGMLPLIVSKTNRVSMMHRCLSTRLDLVVNGLQIRK